MAVEPVAEHFSHDADIGIRGVGRTKAEAFEQAALALTAAVTEVGSVLPREKVAIACTAPNDALLFTDWLNCLIYEMAVRRMLFGRFEVGIDHGHLRATAWGESVDRARHAPAVEPKGATFTALEVRQRPDDAWIAQCVVDV